MNNITSELPPYPMEELAKLKTKLVEEGREVYDFGTGDPKIPLWDRITETLRTSISPISQYPGAKGSPELMESQWGYLKRRFGIEQTQEIDLMSTRGSKEAVFHVAQSIVGRSGGKKTIIYPDPGYPVYQSSIAFAQGMPCPVKLDARQNYLLEPWDLPKGVQKDAAAIWVNYPHNPTGALAPKSYWEKLVEWCHSNDCLLLSDDCYVDIYDPQLSDDDIPMTPLQISNKGVICFFSLSKRSGMTGYRSGFMVGDSDFITPHLRARANMGVGTPQFIQAASAVAWQDDEHVARRRQIFGERMAACVPLLSDLGCIEAAPKATFYLWCRLPEGCDDISFCLDLAERGVICSPSSWLGAVSGYFRMSLVPELDVTLKAMDLIRMQIKEVQR